VIKSVGNVGGEKITVTHDLEPAGSRVSVTVSSEPEPRLQSCCHIRVSSDQKHLIHCDDPVEDATSTHSVSWKVPKNLLLARNGSINFRQDALLF